MEAVVKEVLPPVENLREELKRREYGLHRGSKLRGMIKTAKDQKRRAKERGTKLKPGSSPSSSNPLPSLNGDLPQLLYTSFPANTLLLFAFLGRRRYTSLR